MVVSSRTIAPGRCDGCGEGRETPTVDRDAAGMPQVALPAPWRRIEMKADDLECEYYVCTVECEEDSA